MKSLIMDNNQLFKALVNSQSLLKSELLEIISKLEKRMDSRFIRVDRRFDSLEKNLSERIDKIGLQSARLEDDTPTLDEFNDLVDRVTVLENKPFIAS